MVPPNSIFSALSFIGFLLASIPLPWHLQAWNTGTCMYMIWTSLGCLIMFVNSIVWNDNVVNWAPVWCDISSRYIVGASIGIPASALCITRRLYYIMKLQSLSYGKKEKKREIVVDVSIGVGLPCVVMALQYVVQGHRFNIFEQIGCYPATMNTLPAYFLVFMWPLLVGLISMVYAACTFRLALIQKSRLREMLHTGCSMSAGRYWRLMALCTTEIIFTVPLSLYAIIMNAVSKPPMPYVSWVYIHWGFSAIGQYPSVAWQTSPASIASLEVTRWCLVLCAFVVFAFFAWTEECRDFYRHAFWSVGRRVGVSIAFPMYRESLPRKATLPIYSDHQAKPNHLSMPVQARVKHRSLPFTLPNLSFAGPPDFAERSRLSSSSQEQSNDDMSGSQRDINSFRGYGHRVHVSWVDIPTAPEPASTGVRRSR
ncbi:hypothetical protein PAXRUDRAFT_831769 [Paxillus rubicundulus Ve08.2h10]|uniref:Uncharacterized protein n=1 Tax=Paxillus rubicundulus Ve08.2h10 TaxID=930991 RepID=A0A0D0D082_9AGAM|nr:hypothetical protein PAXRUDRAFT_831769 [Paxillus rubicundulus Ve08.2h10]